MGVAVDQEEHHGDGSTAAVDSGTGRKWRVADPYFRDPDPSRSGTRRTVSRTEDSHSGRSGERRRGQDLGGSRGTIPIAEYVAAPPRLSSVVLRKRISQGSPTTQSRRCSATRQARLVTIATNLKRAFAISRKTRDLGRLAERLAPGLRRFEHRSHRLLHGRMQRWRSHRSRVARRCTYDSSGPANRCEGGEVAKEGCEGAAKSQFPLTRGILVSAWSRPPRTAVIPRLTRNPALPERSLPGRAGC